MASAAVSCAGAMSQGIVLPLWLVVLLAGLALLAVVALVVRAARWALRRRGERVMKEVNRRFRIQIHPFKLTRHQALVDRLLLDARVLEAAETHAREQGLRSEDVLERVRRYAEEIVPAFNAYIYFRWGYRVARAAARSLYRVRLGSVDEAAIAGIDPKATGVLVMNHRSNMDYLLVSHMVADRTALSYAVGEWARIWPLETLVRWMGAFFVRRNSGDPLYRRVLERYIAISSAEGVTQAVFPEGGLSRDGRLQPPKLGLLDYLARGFDRRGERDLEVLAPALLLRAARRAGGGLVHRRGRVRVHVGHARCLPQAATGRTESAQRRRSGARRSGVRS